MSKTQFRAEITVTGTSVVVQCYSRSVDERQPGWFGTSEQAWSDAAKRLSELVQSAIRKTEEIQLMLERRR